MRLGFLSLGFLCVACSASAAASAPVSASAAHVSFVPDAVDKRADAEDQLEKSRFAISFYQPTYIMPFYYTGSPDQAVYTQTPDDQSIQNLELKFQLSFKYPVLRFSKKHKLYIAYTQMSYWQAYQGSAFFRETNYKPEVFLANRIDMPIGHHGWQANFLNVGAMHQSNGEGGSMERSWNRVYVNLIAGKGNLMMAVQPWYIFHDSTMEEHNPDIGHYMGYEQMIVAYQYHGQEFSLQARNTVESGLQRGGYTLSWSFPTGVHYLKGYLQVFSGYGQSLIEYNHRTNSIGIGFSLSDWL